MATGGIDLVSIIIDDHRTIEQAFRELETGSGPPQHRRALADHVITQLVQHAVAEEQYMYPAVREFLDDGEVVADRELEDHAAAEEVMKDLEDVDASDRRFDELLAQLITDVRGHVEEEENELLPKLGAACSTEQLKDLGDKVLKAKQGAPTRPHPMAPDKPPANQILDPGVGLIDRMRDRLGDRHG